MNKTKNNSIVFGLKILSILAFSLLIIPARASAQSVYSGPSINQTPQVNTAWQIISSINPSSGNKNIGSITVTVTGEGFSPNSIVRVNGSDRMTTFIDYSHLLAQLDVNDTNRNDGGFFITVFDGTSGGRFSNSAYFTINGTVAPITNTNNINRNINSYSSTRINNNRNTNTTSTYRNTTNTTNTTNTADANSNYSNLASNAIFGSDSFMPSGLIQWILFAIIVLLLVILIRKIFGARKSYDEAPMKHA